MLISRNIEPSCAYCAHGAALGRDEVACVKYGIMSVTGSCGAFLYEPTKRVPAVMPKIKPVDLSVGEE